MPGTRTKLSPSERFRKWLRRGWKSGGEIAVAGTLYIFGSVGMIFWKYSQAVPQVAPMYDSSTGLWASCKRGWSDTRNWLLGTTPVKVTQKVSYFIHEVTGGVAGIVVYIPGVIVGTMGMVVATVPGTLNVLFDAKWLDARNYSNRQDSFGKKCGRIYASWERWALHSGPTFFWMGAAILASLGITENTAAGETTLVPLFTAHFWREAAFRIPRHGHKRGWKIKKTDIINPASALSLIVLESIYHAYNKKGLKQDGVALAKMVGTMLLAFGMTYALKYTFPEDAPTGVREHSFPSGEASFAMAVAAFVEYQYNRGFASPFFTVASSIGISRVARQKHYAHDVMASAFVGASAAWIISRIKGAELSNPITLNASSQTVLRNEYVGLSNKMETDSLSTESSHSRHKLLLPEHLFQKCYTEPHSNLSGWMKLNFLKTTHPEGQETVLLPEASTSQPQSRY